MHIIKHIKIYKLINYLKILKSIISDKDNYIFNFTQLMVMSNMLITYK